MDGTRLGDMIRTARKRAGLRLEDVSEHVGVTAGALSHIESGRRLPTPQNAVLIAEVLGIPSEELLLALDREHATRRRGSVDSWRSTGGSSSRAVYSSLPIEALFSGSREEVQAIADAAAPAPASRASARTTARWSEDTGERIAALDQLATVASEAIRTLRGLLGDDDSAVAHEAARLLRELEVPGPRE